MSNPEEPTREFVRKQYIDTPTRVSSSIDVDGNGNGSPSKSHGTIGGYRIVREVGRGGMGVVYEAEEVALARRVALKVLPMSGLLDEERIQRFRHEAQAVAQMHHPNIVSIYAVGHEGGVHYYAMRYIDGQNLADVIGAMQEVRRESETDKQKQRTTIRNALRDSGSFPSNEFVEVCTHQTPAPRTAYTSFVDLAIQLADALVHAHSVGIIHRDIKPSNLLIDATGTPWIADFGLALIQGQDNLTVTGEFVGTLRYMSPEQAMAGRISVDSRTDIYSLGITLYELLTLQHAFNGESLDEIIRQVTFDEPTPIRRLNARIPREIETIVNKAISKSPEDRYQTAAELADDFRHFRNDEPIVAKPPTAMQRLLKWGRRHKPLVASIGIATVISLIAAVISSAAIWTAYRKERDTNDELTRANRKSESGRLSALGLLSLPTNPGAAIALALEAVKLDNSPDASSVLLRTMDALHERRTLGLDDHGNLIGHNAAVGNAEWSPDGTRVVTAVLRFKESDQPAILWNAENGEILAKLSTGNCITDAVFNPAGNVVLTTSSRKDAQSTADRADDHARLPVVLWSVPDGHLLHTLREAFVIDADRRQFSPDGQRVVTPSYGNRATIWGVNTGTAQIELVGHSSRVVSAVFSPDGRTVATTSDDDTVRIWNASSGESIQEFTWPNSDSRRPVARSLDFSSDGQLLLVTTPQAVELRQLSDGELLATHRRVSSCGFIPDTRYYYTASTSMFRIYSMDSRTEVSQIGAETRPAFGGSVIDDTGRFLACSQGPHVEVWNLRTSQLEATLRGHAGRINSIRFRHDGNQLVTSSDDETARVWHRRTGAERAVIAGQIKETRLSGPQYRFSDDGTHLLFADSTSDVTLILDNAYQQLREVPGMICSQDGTSHFLTTERDRLYLWSGSGTRVESLTTTNAPLRAEASGAPGTIAWYTSESGVFVRRAESDSTQTILKSAFASDIAFDSGGDRLAVGTRSGMVFILNTETWEESRAYDCGSKIQDVVYSHSGDVLLVIPERSNPVLLRGDDDPALQLPSTDTFSEGRFTTNDQHVVAIHSIKGPKVGCWETATGETTSISDCPSPCTIAVEPGAPRVAIGSMEGIDLLNLLDGTRETLATRPSLQLIFQSDKTLVASAPIGSPEMLREGQRYELPEIIAVASNEDSTRHALSVRPTRIRKSSDGLAISGTRFGVRAFDLRSRQSRQTHLHADRVSALGMTSDLIVSASWDSTVQFVDHFGQRKEVFRKHGAPVTCGELSPNGEVFVTFDADGVGFLWNLGARQSVTLRGHTALVTSVRFDSDGDRFITASRDGSARIWNLKGESIPP